MCHKLYFTEKIFEDKCETKVGLKHVYTCEKLSREPIRKEACSPLHMLKQDYPKRG